MKDRIPFSELRCAMNSLYPHIKHQMNNAISNYENSKKPEALFFAIIAFEELMKFSEYVDHYNNKKGISVKLHTKLSDHKYKLTTVSRIMDFVGNVSTSEYKKLLEKSKVKLGNDIEQEYDNIEQECGNIQKNSALWREIMLGLDFLKQLILYFDWKNGCEITVNRYMRHTLTKNDIDHVTLFFIEYVIAHMNEVLIRRTFPSDIFYEIPNESNIMVDSEYWRSMESFLQRQNTDLLHSKITFVTFLLEIRELEKNVKRKEIV